MRPEVLLAGALAVAQCVLADDNITSTTNSSAAPTATLQTTIAPPQSETIAIQAGLASWYGEDHRGRLMANGNPFDPDKLTAASWFYPLGTRVCVTLKTDPRILNPQPTRSVWVTITDRGPHRRLVRDGRIIDLSYGVFRQLADPDVGLIEVLVCPEVPSSQLAVRSPAG